MVDEVEDQPPDQFPRAAECQAIVKVAAFVQTIETSGSQRRPQMHEAGQTQQLPKPARGLAAFEPYNLEEAILLQTRCRYRGAVIYQTGIGGRALSRKSGECAFSRAAGVRVRASPGGRL